MPEYTKNMQKNMFFYLCFKKNINFFSLIHSVLGKRCKKYAKKILSFCEKVVLLQSQNDGGWVRECGVILGEMFERYRNRRQRSCRAYVEV
jgi:hypothetical protein